MFKFIAVILVLCFMFSFISSVLNTNQKQRPIDLIVGVVLFIVYIVFIRMFGGYL